MCDLAQDCQADPVKPFGLFLFCFLLLSLLPGVLSQIPPQDIRQLAETESSRLSLCVGWVRGGKRSVYDCNSTQ